MYSIVYKKHNKMEEIIYKRRIVDKIIDYLKSKEVIVIYGARQVGKTFLLKYLIKNHLKNVFYFDLELPNLLELCNQGAESVFKYLIQKGADEKQRVFLVIDEIQYMEDPSKFLKIMHDNYFNIKYIPNNIFRNLYTKTCKTMRGVEE